MKDVIAGLDGAGLKRLEDNARRLIESGPAKRRSEAEAVLDAIDEERLRRTEIERQAVIARKEEIEARTKDLGLFDRVVLAFSEVPPVEWEAEMLKAMARNPDSAGDTLARAVGKRDLGYVNLALGSLCSAREPYLVTRDWLAKPTDKRWYSEFITDFTHTASEDGTSRTRWTLKPEAEAALRHLRIV